MAYSNFTLGRVIQEFGLTADTSRDLFGHISAVPLSAETRSVLQRNTPLALLMHTEKARSELLVAQVLADLWQRTNHGVSIFSGVELTVDPSVGLTGTCDFLIGRPPQLLEVSPPILVVVEAKRDSIPDGYGQCSAEMVAALRLNGQHQTGVDTVYGCVTTGTNWRFLRLHGTNLDIDLAEYQLPQADRIFGILLFMVGHNPPAVAAA